MGIKEKYSDVLQFAAQLKIQNIEATETEGKLKIKGNAPYQMEKDLLWDKIKTYANWSAEVAADIRVDKTDVYGMYTVKSGDTLSKLAKGHLGDAKRYMEIFDLNKDLLKDPNLIKVGQVLKLPKR